MARLLRQYKSTIYGNYRKAYTLYGLVAGIVMAVVTGIAYIIHKPINSPESYVTDITLFICMIIGSYLYRSQLPNQMVSFKELMQLNLGLAVVASLIYGITLVLYGNIIDDCFFARCTEIFTHNIELSDQPQEIKDNAIFAYQHYSAWHWASIGAFRSAVMGIIEAFLAALILRTEKQKLKD